MNLSLYSLESLASQEERKSNLQVSVYRRIYFKTWKYTDSVIHEIAIKYQHWFEYLMKKYILLIFIHPIFIKLKSL